MPKNMVGKLVRCMCGTRDAGAVWETCYTGWLVGMDFVQGVASPCCFGHKAWKVIVVVHGDDVTAPGNADGLSKYEEGMTNTFECKTKGRLGRIRRPEADASAKSDCEDHWWWQMRALQG